MTATSLGSVTSTPALRHSPGRGRTTGAKQKLMIAYTALEHGATLVTHDAALLDGAIDGLLVEDWLRAPG
jgi:predicted nucleic acid-binding protein